MALLDWQAGKACQTHYIQVPSQHQEGISPEGKKAKYRYNLQKNFLIKHTNNKNIRSERLATTKQEGSAVLTCTEEHMKTESQGAPTFSELITWNLFSHPPGGGGLRCQWRAGEERENKGRNNH